MVLGFFPTLASGFASVQGSLGDSRLVNFTLEHSYRWLAGLPLADSLWSPPIFFPVRGVAAYTDLMLGAAFLYWPWRAFGFDPLTAYQLWTLCVWSLNFFACYLLLRCGLRSQPWGASAGAYLFTFAIPRFQNIAHLQLAPQFFLIASLAGIVIFFTGGADRRPRHQYLIGSIAFWGGLLLQFYTAIYPFVFYCLGLAGAVAVTFAIPVWRRDFAAAVCRGARQLVVVGLIALLLAGPLALRYVATANTLGVRSEDQVHLPKPLSWVLPGQASVVHERLTRSLPVEEPGDSSQHNGVGLCTLAACAAGLWLGRRCRKTVLVVAAVAGLAVLTWTLPGGWSPWWMVRAAFPGAAGLRAVFRVGLMTLFPAAVGLAVLFDRLVCRRRWLMLGVLALCVVVEQVNHGQRFDKAEAVAHIEGIAGTVPAGAAAFLLAVEGPRWDKLVHDDAAWAALAAGVPTVNGRYGNFPPGYPLRTPWLTEEADELSLRSNLASWLAGRGVDPAGVVIITEAARPDRHRAADAATDPTD